MLEGAVPERSTFSKARHGRFRESEAFRLVFEAVVRSCMTAGLLGGEGFAIDASIIEADASHARRTEASSLPPDWSDPATAARPVRDRGRQHASGRARGDPQPPKSLSITDPAAAWTTKGARKVGFAYGVNCLIDMERAIVVDVEASPAHWSQEVGITRTMIRRTAERLGLHL